MIPSLARFFDLTNPQLILLFLLGLLLPLSIFVGRRNVRIRRRELLEKLIQVLGYAAPQADAGGVAATRPAERTDKPAMPPALALAHARYTGIEHDPSTRDWWRAWLKEIGIYLLPTLIFVLLSACGFALLVGVGGEWLAAAEWLLNGLQAEAGQTLAFSTATALVLGAGFVGAYVWSINYLILRIANFDLSPLSFLRTSVHILMTVFVAWVLRQVLAAPGLGDGIALGALLGIAFFAGLYPSLGLRVLIDRLPSWLRLKRDVEEARQIGRHFPLDLIDGIDPSIAFRLHQLEMIDAQNLATTNPVMLYVETPYALCEIIDWMAQAQLLTELGPKRFLIAREHGVRDMIGLLTLGASAAGRGELQSLLGAADGAADGALEARIASIARKPHVRQLQHWWLMLASAYDLPHEAEGGERASPASGAGEAPPPDQRRAA